MQRQAICRSGEFKTRADDGKLTKQSSVLTVALSTTRSAMTSGRF